MRPLIKSQSLQVRVKDVLGHEVVEPVMVNRHWKSEQWEHDPDYRDPDFDVEAHKKDLKENWIKTETKNGTYYKRRSE